MEKLGFKAKFQHCIIKIVIAITILFGFLTSITFSTLITDLSISNNDLKDKIVSSNLKSGCSEDAYNKTTLPPYIPTNKEENKEEKEKENSDDRDLHIYKKYFLSQNIYLNILSKIKMSFIESLILNTTTTPRYILFHCMKSYLI